MNMKYKLIWRTNPQKGKQQKLYAVPVNDGTLTKASPKKETFTVFTLSKGEVSNPVCVIPKYLLTGKRACSGETGASPFSCGGEGVDDNDGFNAGVFNGEKLFSRRIATNSKSGSLINLFNCNDYENTGF
jgi:hypothetical protein